MVSDTQAKVYTKELGAFPYAMSKVILDRARQEKLPDYEKVRKSSNAASKTSSPWWQLLNRMQYHPLNSRQPENTLSDKKKEVEGTMLALVKTFTEGLEEYSVFLNPKRWGDPEHVVEEKPLDDKLPSVVSDAGGDTLAKEPRVRNVSSVLKRRPQCVHSLSERSQL